MPEFKGLKKRYVFVQVLLIAAVLMIVAGIVLYMCNYMPAKGEVLIWVGLLLVLLCLPVSLISGLIYMIKSKTGAQKHITRIETCEWKKRRITIVVEEVPDAGFLHDTFVYVDDNLIARTYAKQDGEKCSIEASFVHGARKVPLRIQQKKGRFLMPEYLAPRGMSYPAPTIYFEVNIDKDTLAAGNPGMTLQNVLYWRFVSFLGGFGVLILVFLAPMDSQSRNRFLYLAVSLLSVAMFRLIAGKTFKRVKKKSPYGHEGKTHE